jgi:hypothetical protein
MATFVLIQAKKEGRAGEDTYKSLWAIGLMTLGLAVFADFVPGVAGPFALLVLLAMAVRNTGALGDVIGGAGTKRGKGTAKKSTAKTSAPHAPQKPGVVVPGSHPPPH